MVMLLTGDVLKLWRSSLCNCLNSIYIDPSIGPKTGTSIAFFVIRRSISIYYPEKYLLTLYVHLFFYMFRPFYSAVMSPKRQYIIEEYALIAYFSDRVIAK